jgi:hypothetical protein
VYQLTVTLNETIWGWEARASLHAVLPGPTLDLIAQRSDTLDWGTAEAPRDALGSTLWVLREWAERLMAPQPIGRWWDSAEQDGLDGGGWGGGEGHSPSEKARRAVE